MSSVTEATTSSLGKQGETDLHCRQLRSSAEVALGPDKRGKRKGEVLAVSFSGNPNQEFGFSVFSLLRIGA
jgi:hypothetical protein